MDLVYILEKNNQRKLDAILKLLKAVDEEFDFETTSTIDEFKNLNEQIESNDRFASFFVSFEIIIIKHLLIIKTISD